MIEFCFFMVLVFIGMYIMSEDNESRNTSLLFLIIFVICLIIAILV